MITSVFLLIIRDINASVVCSPLSGPVCCKLRGDISPGTQWNTCECLEPGGTIQHYGRCSYDIDCKAVYAPVCCRIDRYGFINANAANACECRNKKMGKVLSKGKCTGPPAPAILSSCVRDDGPFCCRFHNENGSYNKNVTDTCGCFFGIILHYGVCKAEDRYTSKFPLLLKWGLNRWKRYYLEVLLSLLLLIGTSSNYLTRTL